MTTFRIYYAIRGEHAHCRVFSGEGETLAMCGKLVMRADDFLSFARFPNTPPPQFHFTVEQSSDVGTLDVVADWLALPVGLQTRDKLLEMLTGTEKAPIDPRDPDPTRSGMFRDHNCWKCNDGAQPCVAGNPRQCEYPHARND